MGIKVKINAHVYWAPLLALAMLFTVGKAASAQNMQPAPPPDRTMQGGGDITHRDIDDMNAFLENHREIAEQLRKDPSLIDNRTWVADHPALQTYLKDHPQIREAFRSNPNLFMHEDDRYNRRVNTISERDLVDMHQFLDNHREIAEQLRKDPTLIDNRQWVAEHPALQQYLHEHPQVSDAFRAHPDAFMRDGEHYGQQGNRDQYARMGDDRSRGELTGFGQFLGGHSNVAADLSRDPSLATNKEYLATHPELNEYLQAHPVVNQQLSADPQGVMGSASVQQGGGFNTKPVESTPKPKSPPNQ
jgi:translation initiation factor 2 beta subunit (eIF-2beta)/eIF-5